MEKPIATSLDDARAIYEAAKTCGVSVTINHMMLHNAYNKKAAQLIATGTIGERQRNRSAYRISPGSNRGRTEGMAVF